MSMFGSKLNLISRAIGKKLAPKRVYQIMEEIYAGRLGVSTVKEDELVSLIRSVRGIMLGQPVLLELDTPITICGDVHGQFDDLKKLLDMGGWPPDRCYLFLGDYVDRGPHGIETICFLLALKYFCPQKVFLLRGNHESEMVNRIYGFQDECKQRYSMRLFKEFVSLYDVMPLAAVIRGKIFCCHGGISPELHDLRDIRMLSRPCKIPDQGLICDLCWADPGEHDGFQPNERGISLTFGADVLKKFLDRFGFDLLVRAHQVMDTGYEFFADKLCVTIFSATNYCNEFGNAAAILNVDSNLVCSFEILLPLRFQDDQLQEHEEFVADNLKSLAQVFKLPAKRK